MKKLLSALLTAILICIASGAFMSANAAEITPSQPKTGDGSTDNPFEISTAGELYWYADFASNNDTASNEANAVLTADIIVNDDVLKDNGNLNSSKQSEFEEWTPIAGGEYSFASTFDGQGHFISGLYFNDTSKDKVGLFAEITFGTVKNVGIVDSYFNGYDHIGGVCGNNNGSISNCYVLADIKGDSFIGGICGINYQAINNCYTAVSLNANMPNYAGGICGTNNGTINNCYYDKTVYSGEAVGDKDETASEEKVAGKTTDEFASGEVTCLLNSIKSVGTRIWGQTLSGVDKDTYPVAYNGTNNVYYNSETDTYVNKTCTEDDHKNLSASNGICSVCGEMQAPKPNGSGVYQISNAGELYWFAGLVNGTLDGTEKDECANAVLTADITVNKNVLKDNGTLNSGTFIEWTPIGNNNQVYRGIFDGQGHIVSGLYVNDTSKEKVGLFGWNGELVKNVGVVDSYFNGRYYIGGVCGQNENTISNCYAIGNINGEWNIGGVCGQNGNTISNCYAACIITKKGETEDESFGGVCGSNSDTIRNCCYDSDVYSGKAVGENDGEVTAENVKGYSSKKFMSGEVAYILNYPYSIGSRIWGQTLSGDDNDAYPVAYNGENGVYYDSQTDKYENKTCTEYDHADLSESNGICTVCGKLSIPKKDGRGVYQISNAGELYWFAGLVNGTLTDGTEQDSYANAVLTADITVNKNVLKDDGTINSGLFIEWNMIGNYYQEYKGTFDGQGHVVSGLYFNDTSADYVGLFGSITELVQNVGVVDSYFNGIYYIGGICGENTGTINNCYVLADINGKYDIGVVCGKNTGTINNCYYDSTVYTGIAIGVNYGTANNVKGKTTDEFASGEVAYLLNSDQEVGAVRVWGQTLIGDDKDTYPTAYNGKNSVCYDSENKKYINKTCTEDEHADLSASNGICPVCGKISTPKQDGSEVYQISNAGELYWFAGLVNGNKNVCTGDVAQNNSANAVLTADITVNSNVLKDDGTLNTDKKFLIWTPIGDNENRFGGSFDGQGHVISGLYFNDTSMEYVGLFGSITELVQNVGVVDSYFNGDSHVGGICGYNFEGEIVNSYVACNVNGRDRVGGVCGYNGFGTINNCYYDSDVYTGSAIGEDYGTVNNVEGKTTTEFASGEVAYLLNGSTSEGTLAWGQTLTGDKKQAYPSCSGAKVYALTDGYSNTRIVAAKATENVPSFESATIYDADGKETTDITYSDGLDITTVYVKIDGAKDGVTPKITVSKGTDDEIESSKWTAVEGTNIYYAQFIGNFDDFGTIEVSYEGTDTVTVAE